MASFSEESKKLFGINDESSHAELSIARNKATTKEQQNELGPAEHAAFAKEVVQENPWMAIPVGLAIPLYEAAKATGILEGRSDASFDSITEAYKGIYKGLTTDDTKRKTK